MGILSRVTCLLLCILCAFPVQAAAAPEIVINEIAWMGSEGSFADEWIELYNNINSPINLNGWTLRSTDGTPEINLTGTIAANEFYLLERTDDETVPDIKADLIYKGSLSNQGEFLELITASGETADQINCSSGWFTGDNETKRTMERKSPYLPGNSLENWQKSQSPGGTPRAKNSLGDKLGNNPPAAPETKVTPLKNEFAKTENKTPENEQPSESSFPFSLLLITFSIAIFSGIIILILKRAAARPTDPGPPIKEE